MQPEILDFLNNHRIASLTTLLENGAPHAAAVHYSHHHQPLEIYFSTDNTSLKCQAVLDGEKTKASVVIGFSEEEWKTLQLDGEIQAVLDPTELKSIQAIHYKKHPDSEKYKDEPTTIFLKFIPQWWRYSDYNVVPPAIVAS